MKIAQCYTMPVLELAALRPNMKADFRALTLKKAVLAFWPLFAVFLVSAIKKRQTRSGIDLPKQRSCIGLLTPYPVPQNIKGIYGPGRSRSPHAFSFERLHRAFTGLTINNQYRHSR